MPSLSRWIVAARSVLALLLALVAIVLVNMVGAWLSDAVFGLPGGGDLRLSADLFWVFAAGTVGAGLMVAVAAVAKTAHAWAIFAIYLAADLYAAIAMWDDFPRWFTLGGLALLPLQVWLGWWLAYGRKRRRDARDTA